MPYLDNTFGIEIECYLPTGATAHQAAAAITVRGVACSAESYNHLVRTNWKIITDGSLGDYTRGIEAVSPILRGEEGLAAIEHVMGALTDLGCTVSRRCGLHVHVGVGPELSLFKNALKLYAYYEPVIDSFMPPSRRGSLNTYSRSVTSASPSAVDSATDLSSIIRTVGDTQERYYKLNLAAYRRYRTIEFRQHSGTLDGVKARRWTTFCLRMIDAASHGRGLPVMTTSVTTPTQTPPDIRQRRQVNRARYGTNTYRIGQLLLRPEGVTYAEARAATGWRQLSMPPIAAACGLTFTTQRTGSVLRFFAAPVITVTPIAQTTVPTITAFASTPPTLDSLLDALQCDPVERTYFRNRTTNLSGSTDWAA